MIKLLRVDDRLLHGEVSFFWTEYLHLRKILICNDEAANDDFTKMILELAKPKEVQLLVEEIKESQQIIQQLNDENENSIVIVSNLFDAQMIYLQCKLDVDINLGGLRERPNCRRICDYIALSSEDIQIIGELLQKRRSIWACKSPRDEKIVIDSI